jgi:DNA repair protein RecO (recombination protein O)
MATVETFDCEAAYVLHRRAYRDTSALVELLTAHYGRIGLVARGVQRRRSRQAAILQPFQPLRVSWRSRGDLGTLTDAEPASPPITLTGQRMVAGFYANELMLRLLPRHDAHSLTFSRYAALLGQLTGDASIGPSLRVFERDLLTDLGYGLLLDTDTHGDAVQAGTWYRYDLERGPIPEEQGAGLGVPGDALLALAAGQPDTTHDPPLKRLMRSVLRLYLGDKPLKSRELYTRYADVGPTHSEDTTNE